MAPIDNTIEDPLQINFSLPTDQIINVSVTLTSIMGVSLIFKDMQISKLCFSVADSQHFPQEQLMFKI